MTKLSNFKKKLNKKFNKSNSIRVFEKKQSSPLTLPPERYIMRDVNSVDKVLEDFAIWLRINHKYEIIRERPDMLFVLMREYSYYCMDNRFEIMIKEEWWNE